MKYKCGLLEIQSQNKPFQQKPLKLNFQDNKKYANKTKIQKGKQKISKESKKVDKENKDPESTQIDQKIS